VKRRSFLAALGLFPLSLRAETGDLWFFFDRRNGFILQAESDITIKAGERITVDTKACELRIGENTYRPRGRSMAS
jgi:hypothetical protein